MKNLIKQNTSVGFSGLQIVLVCAISVVIMSVNSARADVSKELESLGSNKEASQRATHLDSRTRVGLVQNRSVNRSMRFELGMNYGAVASGDSYLQTQNLGGQLDFHFTPKFSLGVRYEKTFNNLTPEGQQVFDNAHRSQAAGDTNGRIPDLDYKESEVMAIANWYMIYGKINMFDASIVQFDIYSLGGYGRATLASGDTPTWTAGAGIGFWISQHFTSRFELRYQNYTDQVYSGSRNLNLIVANMGLGVLL
jgi:outer membrane immunogenic protein